MPQVSLIRLLLCASVCCAFAQETSKLEFEVATIKPSPPPEPGQGYTVGCKGGPGQTDPEMFRCQNMSPMNFISRAFGMSSYLVTGPDWLRADKFDVTAKVPAGTTKEQFAIMLQNMLIDRFKLATHHESKEIARYDLVVAKNGLKLKESVDAPAPKDDPTPYRMTLGTDGYPKLAPGRPGMAIMNDRARLFYPKWTMEQLAGQLSGQLGKPVTDATGLKGKYDIALYWFAGSVRAAPMPSGGGGGANTLPAAPEGDGGPTLERAIQDQLGLRLEPKKGPVDFLVVDHMEKLPTDN